jgi:Tfp pilus assembly protein PilO
MIPLRRVLEEKRRLVVPLALVLAADAALYAVAVYPLGRRVEAAEARAQAARAALQAARRAEETARATVVGLDQASVELRRFYEQVLPADRAGARRITYLRLARLAREANLSPAHGAFDVRPLRDSRLARLATTLELRGQYRDIRRFLYALETAPEFTVIENVELAQTDDDGGALQVTLTVSTYFRATGDGG